MSGKPPVVPSTQEKNPNAKPRVLTFERYKARNTLRPNPPINIPPPPLPIPTTRSGTAVRIRHEIEHIRQILKVAVNDADKQALTKKLKTLRKKEKKRKRLVKKLAQEIL